MRLAVLTNKPTHYRVPLFERLAREEGVEVRLLFDGTSAAERRGRLPFAADHVGAALALPRRGQEGEEMPSLRLGAGYLPRLAAFRPDVVVSGELGWRTLHATAWAALARVPLLVWWEGTAESDGDAGRLREALRRAIAPRAAGLLGFGDGAVAYLRRIAPPGVPIERVPQAVDNDRIARAADRARPEREALREALGVEGTVLACVGRLVPRKGVRELLAALERFASKTGRPAPHVLLIGDGPLRGEALRAAERLDGRLHVLGALPPDALPRHLVAADALLFPTRRDCWGMVVNEALVAGLPVLGSRHSAAVQELVTRDALGCRFDPLDPDAFDAVLRDAVVEERFRATSVDETRRAVAGHRIEDAARAILDGARRALRGADAPCPT